MRIDQLKFWGSVSQKMPARDKRTSYPVTKFRVEEDAKQKSTMIYVNTRKEPLTELAIETSSRNFSRAAAVEVPVMRDGKQLWSEIGRSQISMIDFGGYHSESLTIGFPEQRQSEYRIVIRNADSPPLEIKAVRTSGYVYQAVFLAVVDTKYRLGYGSPEAEKPVYDAIAVLMPLREGHDPVEAKLGPEIAAADLPSPPWKWQDLLNDVRFLGPAIVVLIAVLALALVLAARRVNELPKE